jgi:hypothetical protein
MRGGGVVTQLPPPPADADTDDIQFSNSALSLFRTQCRSIPEYGRYARHLGRGPEQVLHWKDIPPVPVSAFRSHDLSEAWPGTERVTFETSGTTISRPGRIRLSDTNGYESSLRMSFEAHLLADGARLPIIVFGPTREEAPRSSLWFMADVVARSLCDGATWVVESGEPRWDRADEELRRAVWGKRPVLLLGTSLLFLAYFERCDREGIRFELPEGSRAMDTGGAKATGREIRREDVKAAFERVLAIPSTHLVNEYGMTEMGSQFYEDHLRALHRGRPAKPGFTIAPWVRTRVFDPRTTRECAPGESGYLVHYDLTNREIPLAIQTEDVGNVLAGRLTHQGRLPEAERRGCSLPFEKFIDHLETMTQLAPGQVEFDGDMARGRLKRKPS